MSVASTGQQFNAFTGRIVAEGYSTSGKAVVDLAAGTYFIETIPRTAFYKSPANFNPVIESSKWQSLTSLGASIFLPKNDSGFELYSKPVFDDGGLSGLANSSFYSGVVWDGTNFCASIQNISTGAASLIAYGTDFVNWEYRDVGSQWAVATNSSGANNFVYNADVTNKYVFCVSTTSTTGALWTSTDFITWTSRNLPVGAEPGGPVGVVINSNATNKYVLYLGSGSGNFFCYSTNAVTWSQATFTYNNFVRGFGATNNTASTNQIYVYPADLASGNNMLTSTDGVTWTSRSSGFVTAGTHVVYFDNKYYFFHGSTNYSYSTDGVTWTTATNLHMTPSSNIKSVIFDNKLYVAGGTSGWFNITTNGTTWTLERFNTNNTIALATDGTNLYWHTTSGNANSGKARPPLWYRIYAVNDSTPMA